LYYNLKDFQAISFNSKAFEEIAEGFKGKLFFTLSFL